MFVRQKANKSGSVSIQIIDKSLGYKVVKTIGAAKDRAEIEQLIAKAEEFIETSDGKQAGLFHSKSPEELTIENFLAELSNAQIHTIGPELVFGNLFNQIGFNVIKDELFHHLVVARLAYPTSKLKTVDYLYRYRGIRMEVDTVYRFLDKLCDKYKETVERVAYEYTKRTLKGISVVFYDVTTLYFEAEDEDDLRKIGFSKDGKFQSPQIMLGLLVGQNGYPVGYNIFEGNAFEGHTLLPVLEGIQRKYGLSKPTVITDAAMLSKKNLDNLAKEKYRFIIGGRIKNETDKVQQKILDQAKGLDDGQSFVLKKPDGTRLVVTYSDKRQRKDAHNRERGLFKLRQKVRSGKLTKESINNRGYNKFLALKGTVKVEIDEEKVKEDQKWDGLKGYITNTRLSPKSIVENYRHLWQIEKAFRISKTDLRIRPVYHYRRKRIEAHICIAFAAYTIYKELERLLDSHKAGFSPKRAAELTHNMYELEYTVPGSSKIKRIALKMDADQHILHRITRE
ncbi:MAG: IS1634 family transposase [Candidatus Margulisiibacteriota bacterium]